MDRESELADRIKRIAPEEGFDRIAIAPVSPPGGIDKFRSWISRGYHGEMEYLSRNIDRRFDPAGTLPWAESVICLAVSYAPHDGENRCEESASPFVARYARGRDYHKVLKKRSQRLMDRIRLIVPEFIGKVLVDSGPLAERSFAAAAGLGWIGRNGCLIVPGLGSYVVLAEIVCNLRLAPDHPIPSECGDCDACVRACPARACRGDGLIDARRCLSYLTVEKRGQIEREYWALLGPRVFGCDTCQESCPHNCNVPGGDEELARPNRGSSEDRIPAAQSGLADILAWTEKDWDAATRGTALRRATHKMFMRNAILAAGCSRNADLLSSLRFLRTRRPEFAETIDWASSALEA